MSVAVLFYCCVADVQSLADGAQRAEMIYFRFISLLMMFNVPEPRAH